MFWGPGIGLRRAGVVRPGERLRFTGIEDARTVRILVYRIPNDCSGKPLGDYRVARIGRKNVGGPFRFIQLSPDGRWTASLKPGFCSLSSSVEVELSTPAGGSYLSAGLFGSRSARQSVSARHPSPFRAVRPQRFVGAALHRARHQSATAE